MNFTPFLDDVNAALLSIQAAIIDKGYPIDSLIAGRIAETPDIINNLEQSDDLDLLRRYREELGFLETLAEKPLPTAVESRVEFVRMVYKYDEIGLGNILDIRRVSQSPEPFEAAPAPAAWLDKVLGHTRPSQPEARTAAFGLKPTLRRGECVYFPVYDDPRGGPTKLCFVGKTLD